MKIAVITGASAGLGREFVCQLEGVFPDVGGISGNSRTFDTLPYCAPAKVVRGAYAASRAGRAVYTLTGFYKFYRVLAKLLPQPLMIKFTKT